MVAIHLHQPRSRARRHDEIRFWRDAGCRVVATLGEWRRRARDRAELAALDERTLADIGLRRNITGFHRSDDYPNANTNEDRI